MKKFITGVLIFCMVFTMVVVFHEPVSCSASDPTLNPPADITLPLTISLCSTALVMALVIILTHQPDDKEKKKTESDGKNQWKAAAPSPITATAGTTSAGAVTNTDAASDTLERKLKDLKALHDSKDITDEEYRQMKEKLLLDFK